MASPRITKTMREGIVRNAIDHSFKEAREDLVKREKELADRAYKELYTAQEVLHMEALGSRFIKRSTTITVNCGGPRYRLSFDGKGDRYVHEERVARLMEDSQYHNPLVPSDPLKLAVDALMVDREELDKKVERASIQLTAMLESVTTFKKLRMVWPDGEKFFDMYDVDSERPGVPAVVVQDINKLLGLGKAA